MIAAGVLGMRKMSSRTSWMVVAMTLVVVTGVMLLSHQPKGINDRSRRQRFYNEKKVIRRRATNMRTGSNDNGRRQTDDWRHGQFFSEVYPRRS